MMMVELQMSVIVSWQVIIQIFQQQSLSMRSRSDHLDSHLAHVSILTFPLLVLDQIKKPLWLLKHCPDLIQLWVALFSLC